MLAHVVYITCHKCQWRKHEHRIVKPEVRLPHFLAV